MDIQGNPTGKTTKRKRAMPPGLTKQEEKVLKKVTRRAHRLDKCFSFCGIKIGWGAIFGIIPGAGDIFDSFMALMVVWTCTQVNIPPALKSRMMLNVTIDFLIGLVPFLGDVADALYRCNTRNAALLYKHLQQRGAARLERGEVPGQREASRNRRNNSQNQHSPQSGDPSQKQMRQGKPANPQPVPDNPNALNEKTAALGAKDSMQNAQDSRFVQPSDLQAPAPAKTTEPKGPGKAGWLSRFSTFNTRQHEGDVEHDGHEMAQG